jgi:Uma2 family endonuclease
MRDRADDAPAIIEDMDRSATRLEPPWPEADDWLERDHVVVMRGVPWEQYEALLRTRGEAPQPRFAYLDGDLEIMTKGFRHEVGKKLLARLVETYAEERHLSLNGIGEMTFRKKAKKAGLEPDECYFIGGYRGVPDFAIEIVETSSDVDKLEIYRRLRVPEVWFWIEGKIWVYVQVKRHFEHCERSAALPRLDLEDLARRVRTTADDRQTEAVRTYRRWLQRHE